MQQQAAEPASESYRQWGRRRRMGLSVRVIGRERMEGQGKRQRDAIVW